jgi:hypothetical protein
LTATLVLLMEAVAQAQSSGTGNITGSLLGRTIPSSPPRLRALPQTTPPQIGFPSRPPDFPRQRISPFTGGTMSGTQSGQQQGGGFVGGQGGLGGGLGGGGFGGLGGGGFGGLGGGGLGGLGGGLGGQAIGGGAIGAIQGGFPGGGQLGGGFFGGFGGFGGGFGGGKQFGFDGGSHSEPSFRSPVMDGGLSDFRSSSGAVLPAIERAQADEAVNDNGGAALRHKKIWALPKASK